MNCGALLFAFDSEVKYTKLAVECAKRIQNYLKIPVSLITDHEMDTDIFDNQIIIDKTFGTNKKYWYDRRQQTSWYNQGRCSALDHTPYERTLLLDIDYMVNSGDLLPLIQSSQSFLCHRNVQNVNGSKYISTMGVRNTQMWWATVIIFDKERFSRDVFHAWQMVEKHYTHYADLFAFSRKQFRNDYALSLALLLANGNIMPENCEIPWPLLNVEPETGTVSLVDNTWWINYSTKNIPKKVCVQNHDLHIMGKSYLEKIFDLSS